MVCVNNDQRYVGRHSREHVAVLTYMSIRLISPLPLHTVFSEVHPPICGGDGCLRSFCGCYLSLIFVTNASCSISRQILAVTSMFSGDRF